MQGADWGKSEELGFSPGGAVISPREMGPSLTHFGLRFLVYTVKALDKFTIKVPAGSFILCIFSSLQQIIIASLKPAFH